VLPLRISDEMIFLAGNPSAAAFLASTLTKMESRLFKAEHHDLTYSNNQHRVTRHRGARDLARGCVRIQKYAIGST
jgi:hypothetical protein